MRLFLLILSICYLSFAPLANTLLIASNQKQQTLNDQLHYLDMQIQDLEDERDKYLAKAARAQDQGDRLQFESGYLTEARRYWKVADACKEIAKKIDEQIILLQKQRQELLKELHLT